MRDTLPIFSALLLVSLAVLSAADLPDTKATAPGKPAATAAKAVFQYKADDIAIPTATADEPKAAAFGAESIRAAAKYPMIVPRPGRGHARASHATRRASIWPSAWF